MKYEESFAKFDTELLNLIQKTVPESFAGNMAESGVEFSFPKDKELELKVKYDVREDGGSLSLKISWEDEFGEEEEDEDEECEECED